MKLKNINFNEGSLRPIVIKDEKPKNLLYGTYRQRIPLISDSSLLSDKNKIIKLRKPTRNLMDFKPISYDKHPYDYEKRTHAKLSHHFKFKVVGKVFDLNKV